MFKILIFIRRMYLLILQQIFEKFSSVDDALFHSEHTVKSHYISYYPRDSAAASVFEVHCRKVSILFLSNSKTQHIRISHTYFLMP